jgi:hypothetical protein
VPPAIEAPPGLEHPHERHAPLDGELFGVQALLDARRGVGAAADREVVAADDDRASLDAGRADDDAGRREVVAVCIGRAGDPAALDERVAVDQPHDALACVQEAAFGPFLEGVATAHLQRARPAALDLVDFRLPGHGVGR